MEELRHPMLLEKRRFGVFCVSGVRGGAKWLRCGVGVVEGCVGAAVAVASSIQGCPRAWQAPKKNPAHGWVKGLGWVVVGLFF